MHLNSRFVIGESWQVEGVPVLAGPSSIINNLRALVPNKVAVIARASYMEEKYILSSLTLETFN